MYAACMITHHAHSIPKKEDSLSRTNTGQTNIKIHLDIEIKTIIVNKLKMHIANVLVLMY